jgi:hypothetical protein
MKLVADVRHRQLADDPAVLGVDDGEEVGLLHAGAPVQAGDVEKLLRRRARGVRGRQVQRARAVLLAHREPPSSGFTARSEMLLTS